MSLKNKIRDYITNNGPKSDRELAAHFNEKQPSVRRSRGELVKAGDLVAAEKGDEKRWQIPSKGKQEKAEAAPRFKSEPDPVPADKKDWRTNGFTF